jgi:hypothetical protein
MKNRNGKQKFTALTVDGKGNKKDFSVHTISSDAAAEITLKQGHFPLAKPESKMGKLNINAKIDHQNLTPAEAKIIARGSPQILKKVQDRSDKHYAALGERPGGKEGLAIVDATNTTAAMAKLQDIGVRPYHTPIVQSLKFSHGNTITKVHDDGDLTARIQGKEVVITQNGQVYGAIEEGQGTYIKESLRNSYNALKAEMIQKFQKGKLPGAPLGKNGIPRMLPPPRIVKTHRARYGGLTRRSDR